MLWLRDLWHRSPRALVACNENAPEREETAPEREETAPERDAGVADVRALATGAALATALDASPAVLVSIYEYAHRYRDRNRRSA
jgi:hypothetical protein